jgi:hypothetical protein
MNLSKENKALLASYGRTTFAAVMAVVATGNYSPDDLVKAVLISVLPPLLRYVNSNDKAFGRSK